MAAFRVPHTYDEKNPINLWAGLPSHRVQFLATECFPCAAA